MDSPTILRPAEHALYAPDRMGKATLFSSAAMLVGLNAFEPGQQHALHAHEAMDKLYLAIEGRGTLLLEDRELPLATGELTVAPAGVPHGIRNDGPDRLLLLAVLSPGPG